MAEAVSKFSWNQRRRRPKSGLPNCLVDVMPSNYTLHSVTIFDINFVTHAVDGPALNAQVLSIKRTLAVKRLLFIKRIVSC